MEQLYELYAYSCNERQYTNPLALVTIDTVLASTVKELSSREGVDPKKITSSFSGFNCNDINISYIDLYGDECYEIYSIKPVDMKYLVQDNKIGLN